MPKKLMEHKVILNALYWLNYKLIELPVTSEVHKHYIESLRQIGFLTVKGPSFDILVHDCTIAWVRYKSIMSFALAFRVFPVFPIYIVNLIEIDPKKISAALLTAEYEEEEEIPILAGERICPFCYKKLYIDRHCEFDEECTESVFCSGGMSSCKCMGKIVFCGHEFGYIHAHEVKENELRKLINVLKWRQCGWESWQSGQK